MNTQSDSGPLFVAAKCRSGTPAGDVETPARQIGRSDIQTSQDGRMEALAQVAGGLAHDLNDLLTIILGRARRLLDEEDPPPRFVEDLGQIYSASERAASLMRQLLIFGGQLTPQRQTLDLNALVSEIAPTLRRLLGKAIALELRLTSSLPLIRADADMLEQVVVNLATNAHRAIPAGGRVVIRTAIATVTTAEIPAEATAQPGTFVRLEIVDPGSGMPPEILPRLFEPFGPIKGAGRNGGLGLATVWSIVRQHGGWVNVISAPGTGSTFTVFWPAAPAGSAVDAATADKIDRRPATVLLVEDETGVRELVAAVLKEQGYRVLQAGSSVDVLEAWKWHGPRVDLLLTDLLLEGDLTGLDLAAKLRVDNPRLPVICLTGCSRGTTGEPPAAALDYRFLRKPCRPERLLAAVRDALDARSV